MASPEQPAAPGSPSSGEYDGATLDAPASSSVWPESDRRVEAPLVLPPVVTPAAPRSLVVPVLLMFVTAACLSALVVWAGLSLLT